MKDIVFCSVSKSFGEKQVLKDLSFILPYGSRTALMGRSGSGKTTVSNLMLRLISPDSGSISGLPERASAVFQEDRLPECFTVFSNLRFALGKTPADSELVSCLDALGLNGQQRVRVSELSGGMKRRVSIARAILAPGELLVLDEPFRGLDPDTRAAAATEILRRQNGRTLLCITHDPAEAELLMADQVIRLG